MGIESQRPAKRRVTPSALICRRITKASRASELSSFGAIPQHSSLDRFRVWKMSCHKLETALDGDGEVPVQGSKAEPAFSVRPPAESTEKAPLQGQ